MDPARGGRRISATRVLRPGDPTPAEELEPDGAMTMEERLAAVWERTLECLAWSDPDADEPRLQRSAVVIQRARR